MGSELPADWDEVRLGDCGRWLSGGTPSTKNPDFWDGDIPWISGKSLTTHYLRDSDRRVTTLGAANGTRIAPQGSTLMVVRGMSLQTEFRSGIAMQDLAFGQDCKAIIPREGIEPRFLANAVRARAPEILGMVDSSSHGTGRLATELIQALRIGLPPWEEQRAIAEVLGALDDRIEWCDAGTSLAHALARSVAEHFEADSTVGLADVADIRRSTISATKLQGRWWTHYSIPAFDDGQQPLVEPGSEIRSGKFSVPPDSVLVSKLNPTWPRVWLPAAEDDPPAICSTELMPVVPRGSSEATTAALWAALLTPSFNRQLRERVQGSTGSHQRVRPEDMLACRVMNPAALTTSTGELLASLAARVLELRVERRSLVSSRDALLPRLLSGEVRIGDPARVLGAVA